MGSLVCGQGEEARVWLQVSLTVLNGDLLVCLCRSSVLQPEAPRPGTEGWVSVWGCVGKVMGGGGAQRVDDWSLVPPPCAGPT